jgi:hypothetical protein
MYYTRMKCTLTYPHIVDGEIVVLFGTLNPFSDVPCSDLRVSVGTARVLAYLYV